MADKGEPRLTTLPPLVIQHEVQKVVLEPHALDYRLSSLQRAIGLVPAELPDGTSRWADTHELALWVALERARESLATFVLERLRYASRIPEGYPETEMPQDPLHECRHIRTGEKQLKRRIGGRQRAGVWYRSHPDDTAD